MLCQVGAYARAYAIVCAYAKVGAYAKVRAYARAYTKVRAYARGRRELAPTLVLKNCPQKRRLWMKVRLSSTA
jgi:hypothetical protein